MPDDKQKEYTYDRRTRRNVVAMAGILVSSLATATMGATRIANAAGRNNGRNATGRNKYDHGEHHGDRHKDHHKDHHVNHHGDHVEDHQRGPDWGQNWSWERGEQGADSVHHCILSGTKISTEFGEIPVENLKLGDKVLTISGKMQPINRIDNWQPEREPGQDWRYYAAPIKVCRSAIASNVPQRDLYLSPGHAIYLDGMLLRVGGLVNGRSIVRCAQYQANKLSYFHLELDDHQVILAEFAPIESALGERMTPFASTGLGGRRADLASRLRSAISPWIDRRQTCDRIRDRLDERAESDLAA